MKSRSFKILGAAALTVTLLTLAFAPLGQFYLAWIALVPLLWMMRESRSRWTAAGWMYIGGLIFFEFHSWPIATATIPGAIGFAAVLAGSWAVVGFVLHPLLKSEVTNRSALAVTFAIACAWVCGEWLRGRIVVSVPWLYLGHSQTPLLAVCQIADLLGAYAVSFLIAGVNAAIFVLFTQPIERRQRIMVALTWGILAAGSIGYGLVRLSQTRDGSEKQIMVVQSDVVFGGGGVATRNADEHFDLLLRTTREALAQNSVDMIVWPESITPPINIEARTELARFTAGSKLRQRHEELSELARAHGAALLVGGSYVGDWQLVDGKRTGTDIRNSVYQYDSTGRQAARYDKVHLVPFGEYIPFRDSAPRLASALEWFAPRVTPYTVRPGPIDNPATFDVSECRILPAICFEDMLGNEMARAVRQSADAGEPIDLIVVVSNDGWFRRPFMAQRFQAAQFRCIENRIPLARSCNGGISGFIDARGRVTGTLQAWTNEVLVERIQLTQSPQTTLYQTVGDALPLCSSVAILIFLIWNSRTKRRDGDAEVPELARSTPKPAAREPAP